MSGEDRHGWRSSNIFIACVINLAVITDSYLYSLLIPVFPFALTEIIHVPRDDVQWWIGALLAAYGAGLLLACPVVGHYADRTGSRKAPYLMGLIALTASTVAFSLGRSIWVLLVGRFVQGVRYHALHTYS